MTGSFYRLTLKSFVLATLLVSFTQVPLQAQTNKFTEPSWWFGASAAANSNFYQGTTQELNSNFTVPTAFHKGFGVGLFLAPVIEFHPADSRFGLMLQAGFDNRSGAFDQVITPCNCPADLEVNLSYLTVEPSLRIAPFKSDFYLFAGPRLAFNLSKSFLYSQAVNPQYPEQNAVIDVEGDLSNTVKSLFSMKIGLGYDFHLTSSLDRTQLVISPFASYHPYFGQFPRSIESWNITTFRFGAAIKFGLGQAIPEPPEKDPIIMPALVAVIVPEVHFSVNSPENLPVEREVREIFPLRNYIFFNNGSTEIPNRYVLLKKNQVGDFKENQLDAFVPVDFSGRSDRAMIAYYNILNILGDRMDKNENTRITLVGSSMNGQRDALSMAESVKQYLVEVFEVAPARIQTKGQNKPELNSEQPGGVLELKLLREEDRRVTILSESPELLMEFANGPYAPLLPVEIVALETAPVDSYVTFNVVGSTEAFTSWSLEIMDKDGVVQYFGPYSQDHVSIPGKTILGDRHDADFQVKMIGQTKNGDEITEETFTHLVLWTPAEVDNSMKFSVIFEFDDSKTISMYEKFLTNTVTPKIPRGGTVYIRGYTDIIGDEKNNQKLSEARANSVKSIIEKSLKKAGRNDVKFEVYGFGEDPNLSRFGNKFPEQRFYNRMVIIDIIPAK